MDEYKATTGRPRNRARYYPSVWDGEPCMFSSWHGEPARLGVPTLRLHALSCALHAPFHGGQILRWRECRYCRRQVTTYETLP